MKFELIGESAAAWSVATVKTPAKFVRKNWFCAENLIRAALGGHTPACNKPRPTIGVDPVGRGGLHSPPTIATAEAV